MHRIRRLALVLLAAAALLPTFLSTPKPASAGQSYYQESWAPSDRADMSRLIQMHGWSAEQAEKALDRFVYRLGSRSETPGAQLDFLGSFGVGVKIDPSATTNGGCLIAALVLQNALRPRTSVAGAFCGRSQNGWTYMPVFLEVQDIDRQGNVIKTSDVTDIGKRRPALNEGRRGR